MVPVIEVSTAALLQHANVSPMLDPNSMDIMSLGLTLFKYSSSLRLLPLEIQNSPLLVHLRTSPPDIKHDRILEHDEQTPSNQTAAPLLLEQTPAS